MHGWTPPSRSSSHDGARECKHALHLGQQQLPIVRQWYGPLEQTTLLVRTFRHNQANVRLPASEMGVGPQVLQCGRWPRRQRRHVVHIPHSEISDHIKPGTPPLIRRPQTCVEDEHVVAHEAQQLSRLRSGLVSVRKGVKFRIIMRGTPSISWRHKPVHRATGPCRNLGEVQGGGRRRSWGSLELACTRIGHRKTAAQVRRTQDPFLLEGEESAPGRLRP
jgi:hypothetical protein